MALSVDEKQLLREMIANNFYSASGISSITTLQNVAAKSDAEIRSDMITYRERAITNKQALITKYQLSVTSAQADIDRLNNITVGNS